MLHQMTSQLRQLVVVVESTAALGYQWPHLHREYVEKIVRAFYGQDVNGQKLSVTPGETGLVLFNSHHSNHAGLVQHVGCTSNMDVFLHWLCNIQFSGGGFGEVAMAEGLAEALVMCVPGQSVANVTGSDRQKHVLLIATSAPCIIRKPVPTPPISFNGDSKTSESETQWRLADSEDVAKWFPQCYVSLSVICPRRLPQLRAVYNLAKRNSRSTDPEVIIPKQYPYHTVLLSDGFWEARAVLGINGNNSSLPPVSKAELHDIPITSGQTASVITGHSVSVPTGKAKIEISSGLPPVLVTNTKVTTGTGVPVISTGMAPSTNAVQDALNSVSNVVVKQEDVTSAPLVSNTNMLSTGYHAVTQLSRGTNNGALQGADGSFQGVANILSSQVTGVNSFPGVTMGQASMGIGPNTLGGQVGVSGLQVDIAGQGNVANGLRPFGMQPANLMMSRAEVTAISVPNGQLAGGLGQVRGLGTTAIGQPNPRSAGGLTSGSILANRAATQVGGVGANRLSGVTATLSNMAQPTQSLQPSSITQTSQQTLQQTFQPQHTLGQPPANAQPLQQAPQSTQATGVKYAKLWDGVLAGLRQGEPVPICKLECFRQSTSPETLAADWPSTIQIMRLIEQDLMNSKEFQGKAEVLAFRPLNQHAFLLQLAEKKLCAVIQLPSQTLLLASTSMERRMMGMLFPGDMVVFKPNNANPQQSKVINPAASAAPSGSYVGSSIN